MQVCLNFVVEWCQQYPQALADSRALGVSRAASEAFCDSAGSILGVVIGEILFGHGRVRIGCACIFLTNVLPRLHCSRRISGHIRGGRCALFSALGYILFC